MSYILIALFILVGIYIVRQAVDRASARGIVRLVLLLFVVLTIMGILAIRTTNS